VLVSSTLSSSDIKLIKYLKAENVLSTLNSKVKVSITILLLLFIYSVSTLTLHSVYAACTNWAGLVDTDCDGLADTWEIAGYYDRNGDGKVVTLPGANWRHKDIFIEIDYMQSALQSHRPMTSSIDAVRTAFLNAPLWNPDGTIGANLRYIIDDTTPIPDDHPCTTIWPEFDTLKRDYFGTLAQRMSDPTNIVNEKKDVYRYVIFGHQICGSPGSSGISEQPGNDEFVSLGDPGWAPMLDEAEPGTFMHELGHNLNLAHGGGGSTANVNCKPNYISVMSYSFQFPNHVSDRNLDYSRSAIISSGNGLNESRLKEPDGIGPSTPAGLDTVIGKTGDTSEIVVPTGNIPINYDWWSDSDVVETNVKSSINNLGITDCNSDTRSMLYGYSDWLGVRFWDTTGGGTSNGTSLATFLGIAKSALTENATQLSSGISESSFINSTQNKNIPLNSTSSFQLPDVGSSNQTSRNTNPPCDTSNPGCLDYPCDPDDPDVASCTIVTNFTSPTLSINDTFGREKAHPDITINDVRESRALLANGINQMIQNLSDSSFANSTSPIQEKDKFETELMTIGNLSRADMLEEAIIELYNIRSEMDSAFGGSDTNDVIVNPESQMAIVPLIDNLIESLQKQM
jgi:hypothetical protein